MTFAPLVNLAGVETALGRVIHGALALSSTSDTGNLPLVTALDAVLIGAAWRGQLPPGFYLTSAATNLLLLLRMKQFYWWWKRPATLRAARGVHAGIAVAWAVAAMVRVTAAR